MVDMAWCETCNRYLAPPTVRPDGTCPTCRQIVENGRAGSELVTRTELPPVPWHFKLLLGAAAVYLGYRFWEMGAWVWGRL